MKDDLFLERMALGRAMVELIKSLDRGQEMVDKMGAGSDMAVEDATMLVQRKSDGRFFRFTVTDETEKMKNG